MVCSDMATFEHDGVKYSADNIVAVVNVGLNEVEVRYAVGKEPVVLRGIQASAVLSKISIAKNAR